MRRREVVAILGRRRCLPLVSRARRKSAWECQHKGDSAKGFSGNSRSASSCSASARAQNSKPNRIGLIFTTSAPAEMAGAEPSHPSVRAFVQALRELGYQEGRNLILERRSAEGKLERLTEIVADLVRIKSDVIVAVGHRRIIPAVKATTTIPIILVPSYFDPVQAGVVETLARPGKNVTGLTIHQARRSKESKSNCSRRRCRASKRLRFWACK